jgi:hypothetical protein
MDQGLQEGTIRNSHRDIHAVKAKVAPKQVAEKARALIERCSESGAYIRQRLDIDRMKLPLQKSLLYVIENDSHAEPGFLVFLPGQQAPVFVSTRTKGVHPSTLRMRVSPTLGDGGGSVFIATLDAIQHTLRLEDVWMWKGDPIFNTLGYSKRREYLREFVEHLWVPDARLLGGIMTSILNPKSLSEYLENSVGLSYMVEFLPELPGKRRMWYKFGPDIQKRQAPVPVLPRFGGNPEVKQMPPAKPLDRPLAIPTPIKINQNAIRKALAKPVDKMPDIYDLFDEQGVPISRASVQMFSLAQQLRSQMRPEGVWVSIKWRHEFGGYEILNIV